MVPRKVDIRSEDPFAGEALGSDLDAFAVWDLDGTFFAVGDDDVLSYNDPEWLSVSDQAQRDGILKIVNGNWDDWQPRSGGKMRVTLGELRSMVNETFEEENEGPKGYTISNEKRWAEVRKNLKDGFGWVVEAGGVGTSVPWKPPIKLANRTLGTDWDYTQAGIVARDWVYHFKEPDHFRNYGRSYGHYKKALGEDIKKTFYDVVKLLSEVEADPGHETKYNFPDREALKKRSKEISRKFDQAARERKNRRSDLGLAPTEVETQDTVPERPRVPRDPGVYVSQFHQDTKEFVKALDRLRDNLEQQIRDLPIPGNTVDQMDKIVNDANNLRGKVESLIKLYKRNSGRDDED